MYRSLLACGMVLALSACDNTATVNFRTGELLFSVSAPTLPAELRQNTPSGAIVRRVSCGGMVVCPSTAMISISCTGGVCNPAPMTVTAPVGGPVDFDSYSAEFRDLFEVDRVWVREINYRIIGNTLTVDVGPVELLWSPEGAAAGMSLLGTVPATPAQTTGQGSVVLDSVGQAALSDYMIGTSRRVRFFVRTDVDIEPDTAFPEGALEVGVTLFVSASGPIL